MKDSKWKETMLKKYGSEEALSKAMKAQGSKGGKNGTGHAYGHGKVDPALCGAKGGSISRRGYKLINGNYIKKEA